MSVPFFIDNPFSAKRRNHNTLSKYTYKVMSLFADKCSNVLTSLVQQLHYVGSIESLKNGYKLFLRYVLNILKIRARTAWLAP